MGVLKVTAQPFNVRPVNATSVALD